MTMKEIELKLREVLNDSQMKYLHLVLMQYRDCEEQALFPSILNANQQILELFIKSKRLEGCSESTLSYYESTIKRMLTTVQCSYKDITTEVLILLMVGG